MFSALAENEALQARINIVIALAPIAKIGRVDDNTFFASLSKRIPILLQCTQSWGIHEFFDEDW
jgi:hypothetical protein